MDSFVKNRLTETETYVDDEKRVYHELHKVSNSMEAFEKRLANIETYVDDEKRVYHERHKVSNSMEAFEKRLANIETYVDDEKRVYHERHEVSNSMEAFEKRLANIETYVDDEKRVYHELHEVSNSMEAFEKRLANIETYVDDEKRGYHERHEVSNSMEAFEKRLANIETYVDDENLADRERSMETVEKRLAALETFADHAERADRERQEVNKRLDAFEKRVTGIETYVDDEQSVDNHRHEKNGETEKTRSFKVLLTKALNMEKLERVNFISDVQKQVDDLNDTMYQFRTNTANFVSEQISNIYAQFEMSDKNMIAKFDDFGDKTSVNMKKEVGQIKSEFANLRIDTEQFEQNMTDRLIDMGNEFIHGLSKQQLHTASVIDNLAYNITTILNTELDECKADIDLIEVDLTDQRVIVDKNTDELAELRGQYAEHISKVDNTFYYIGQRLVESCQTDWSRHGTSCYYFSKMHQRLGWIEASNQCMDSRSTLVEINTADENEYLTANVKELHATHANWIGLSDRQTENTWTWLASDSSQKPAAAYMNWNSGEPNDANNREDCVMILGNGVWNDGPCELLLRYICEAIDYL